MPKVSVIIATYNYSNYIPNAIDSVLNQTFKDYEIIVVDDGSTDDTEEVLEPYMKRIKYIYKENSGSGPARNIGIKQAKGEYIAFLDADDMWMPEKLELQVEILQSNPKIGLVFSGANVVNKEGIIIRQIKYTEKHRKNAYNEFLSRCFIITPSQIIVRKRCFDKIGYFDERLSCSYDWDLYIRISKYFEISYINMPLINYRIHSSNMHKNLEVLKNNQIKILNQIYNGQEFSNTFYDKQKKESYHRIYFDIGVEYFERFEMRAARRNLLKALTYQPFHKKTITYLLKTLLGSKIFPYIRSAKRILCQRLA